MGFVRRAACGASVWLLRDTALCGACVVAARVLACDGTLSTEGAKPHTTTRSTLIFLPHRRSVVRLLHDESLPVGLQFEVLVELVRDLVELETFRAGLVAQARAEVGFGASDAARGACPEKEDG